MRTVLLVWLLVGCAGYRAGSFRARQLDFTGQHATVGCLDISIRERPPVRGADVLQYTFGNRCDHPAMVDLAAANVIGRLGDGREVELIAYDPNREIRPLPIDGRMVGQEAIAYQAATEVSQICVDAGGIGHGQPQWLCFPGVASRVAEVSP
ncbi:MAG TPA: hypothetical protein VLX92_35260 [Kofleriaceae bacterium]|nr:hypothetical protein [Kofleriaceae bacterium]